MRKRVFKRKKEIKTHKIIVFAGRAAVLAASVAFLIQTPLAVCGREAADDPAGTASQLRQVVTSIYHRHLGQADVQGGCYQQAVAHEHKGDEKTGGGCYTLPVYHQHVGSTAGGGCYTQEVLHEHRGDESSGGDCYEPVYHEHEDGCYQEQRCNITNVGGEVISTRQDNCLQHGTTTFDTANGTSYHDSCGIGSEPAQLYYCHQCGFLPNLNHKYQALICSREGEITGYRKNCDREGEIEGYETGCGYAENEIERYQPDCGITTDGYALSCGLKEDQPCGRLILTSEIAEGGNRGTISVRLEDLSGGHLRLEDDPFSWSDEKGNVLGGGESLEVGENGNYQVSVRLKNKDVDEAGLRSSILVDGIGKGGNPSAAPTGQPSARPSSKPSPVSTAKPTPSKDKPTEAPGTGGNDESGDQQEDDKEPDNPGATPSVSPGNGGGASLPLRKPENGKTDAGTGTDTKNGTGRLKGKDSQNRGTEDGAVSPSPRVTPVVTERQSGEVKARENMSAQKGRRNAAQVVKRNTLFDSPAVRMITLTAGTLFLLGGILAVLLYLRRSVALYNDDGEGRMVYLGRCPVRMEEEGYCIIITDAMIEKSCTNRYRIRPGIFRFGRDEEQEMIVYKEEKKAVVCFGKEMIVTI